MAWPQRVWEGAEGSAACEEYSDRSILLAIRASTGSTLAMLELRQLHYFVVVVEEGQMTSAASRLHIAQPALSQAIAKLEADLGVKLFERHSRGVIPTEAGAAFFERASRA